MIIIHATMEMPEMATIVKRLQTCSTSMIGDLVGGFRNNMCVRHRPYSILYQVRVRAGIFATSSSFDFRRCTNRYRRLCVFRISADGQTSPITHQLRCDLRYFYPGQSNVSRLQQHSCVLCSTSDVVATCCYSMMFDLR
jgi:hypothetical protein